MAGICTGKAPGESCDHSRECEVGNYCSTNKVCAAQVQTGEACPFETACPNTDTCNAHNICVKAFSVEEKGTCTVDNECKGGGCIPGDGDDGAGFCQNLESDFDHPYKCSKDDDCQTKIFNREPSGDLVVANGFCDCGGNANGDKYCKLFNGDYYGIKYYEMLRAWYNGQDILKCNSEKRRSTECRATY